jgi:hypothetical protein
MCAGVLELLALLLATGFTTSLDESYVDTHSTPPQSVRALLALLLALLLVPQKSAPLDRCLLAGKPAVLYY